MSGVERGSRATASMCAYCTDIQYHTQNAARAGGHAARSFYLARPVGLVRAALDAVWRVVLLPFRLLVSLWDLGVRTGYGFFGGLIKLFFGLFGLGLLAFVIYGVGRVLLHPFFR